MKLRRAVVRAAVISIVLGLGCAFLPLGSAWSQEYETVAEQTDYRLTASYDETAAYFHRLAEASPWIEMSTIGKSPQGRELHLVVVSNDGAFTPEAAHATGKTLVLIQNGIHSGEIDGKDACMALVRDIAITKEREDLLDSVVLLIIPIFSVDGHENNDRFTRPNQDGPENAGFRGTAQRLNLNRDYLKVDSPEMAAWIANWLRWMPDFFIDDHVTDGQDWQYTVSYTMAWHPNSAPGIRTWTKSHFDSAFVRKLDTAGHKAFPYAFPFRGPMASGIRTFVDIPRFSTGYTALWNRPGLLIEMHSLKDYETRVRGNYEALVAVLEILTTRGGELQTAIAEADAATLAGLTAPHPLSFAREESESTLVDLLIYQSTRDSTSVTGGVHTRWDRSRPTTLRTAYFDSFNPAKAVTPPRAYLVPREWTPQLERLRAHGVRIDSLTRPFTTPVEIYHIDSVEWAEQSFESHVRVSYVTTAHDTILTYPVGTALIDLHQPAAKVVMQALEPDGPDSYLSWGLWHTVLERKEYIDDYMIDPLADEMVDADPELKRVYEQRLESDSAFAADIQARRNFFYERSRFYEPGYNWYPVGRYLGVDLPPTAPWMGE